ncbi:MAG TPA: cytochrome c-type biogenesis protein CcmH [Longimicrobiales bacterium]|nr:cytochrome c-type biogenesis protein CcmH [Longimicrobiales bacterium]
MTSLPLITQLAVAVTLAVPAGTPMTPALAAQIQQSAGHYHEGEFGAKYLALEQSLKCNCGCGLDVHSCQYQMQCGTSPEWSERIRTELEAGLTPEAIQASFVAEYGPTVLMSPPAEGFNLVGYFLPAVAILSASALVVLVIRGGAGRRREVAPAEPASEAEQARLTAELRKLERSESPDW